MVPAGGWSWIFRTWLWGNSIVVLAFNSSPTMGPGDELIVVDNASSDATLEIVEGFRAADPRVAVIANGANLGFSAGCNVGLRASGGARVLLLNPDTVVYGGWLETLAEGLADPSVGMVGPLSDNIAGDQFVAAHFNLKGRSGLSPQGLAQECREELAGRSVSTKLLIGLCIAMRRETLDEVGLLDEDLFLGNDDLDISWRLRTHGCLHPSQLRGQLRLVAQGDDEPDDEGEHGAAEGEGEGRLRMVAHLDRTVGSRHPVIADRPACLQKGPNVP